MCLVWEDDSYSEGWWAEFNHKESSCNSTDIMEFNGGFIDCNVVLDINEGIMADVKSFDVGSFAGTSRLVSPRLKSFLIEVIGDSAGFFPTICRCSDGDLIGYSLLAPKRHISCVDLDNTDVIDWISPGNTIRRYSKISLKESCLEPMGICRDFHAPYFTIVGRELANMLINKGFTGLRFVEIKDANNPMSII